jgi:hypothetical protein
MDLMSTNTAVTVSDTTAASIEGASTTTGILATAFDSATSNTGVTYSFSPILIFLPGKMSIYSVFPPEK